MDDIQEKIIFYSQKIKGIEELSQIQLKLQSILDCYLRHNKISSSSEKSLKRICKRIDNYSSGFGELWKKNFSEEKRRNFNTCIQFYKNNKKYYQDIVAEVEKNKNYIPTEEIYARVVENTYAQKVLKATFGEPKFKNNQLVQLRAKVESTNSIGFVLFPNSKPITQPRIDGKYYRVLWLNGKSTDEMEGNLISLRESHPLLRKKENK